MLGIRCAEGTVVCAKVPYFALAIPEADNRLAMTITQFDFEVEQHPSFCLVTPLTAQAIAWLSEFTDADIRIGGVLVEWRYIEPLCHGILDADFRITKDGMTISRSEQGALFLV